MSDGRTVAPIERVITPGVTQGSRRTFVSKQQAYQRLRRANGARLNAIKLERNEQVKKDRITTKAQIEAIKLKRAMRLKRDQQTKHLISERIKRGKRDEIAEKAQM